MKLRSVAVLLCAAFITTGLSACADVESPKAAQKPRQSIDENKRELSFEHKLTDTNGNVIVTLVTNYSTDYNVKQWRITDTKTLSFGISVKGGRGAAEPIIMIENAHADVSIQADTEGLDGLPQDSMDDRMHTGTQPGFLLTYEHPYEELFSIEGFSETLISGWGFVAGGYGVSSLSEDRLTESTLLENGAYANGFTFVYDVLIQDPVTGLYYKKIVADEFAVKV